VGAGATRAAAAEETVTANIVGPGAGTGVVCVACAEAGGGARVISASLPPSGNNDSARAKSARAEIFSRIEISFAPRLMKRHREERATEKKGTEITYRRHPPAIAFVASFIVRHRSQSVLQRSNTSTRHGALESTRKARARFRARLPLCRLVFFSRFDRAPSAKK
jgi:hypothetical protein